MEQRTHQARLTTEFLTREMERAEAALRQQSALLREFKEKNRGQLPNELTTKLSRLDRLQPQRQSLALQISDAESRLITLQSTSFESDARARILADLQNRLAQERVVNTEEHPNVLALARQVAALEARHEQPQGAGDDRGQQPAGARGPARADSSLRAQLQMVEADIAKLDARGREHARAPGGDGLAPPARAGAPRHLPRRAAEGAGGEARREPREVEARRAGGAARARRAALRADHPALADLPRRAPRRARARRWRWACSSSCSIR